MNELPIISSLREKRLELAGILDDLERQTNARRADLAHLDATIRLFDPNARLQMGQHRARQHKGRIGWHI